MTSSSAQVAATAASSTAPSGCRRACDVCAAGEGEGGELQGQMRRRGSGQARAVGAERHADEAGVGGEDDREHDVGEQPSRLR